MGVAAMWCVSWFLGLAESQGQTSLSYEVTLIPTPLEQPSAALGINGVGDAVGYRIEGDYFHAFLYSHATGAVRDLGSLGGNVTVPWAITDAREVAGSGTNADGLTEAFILSQGKRMAPAAAVTNNTVTQGLAINSAGQVAGVVQDAPSETRAAVFEENGIQGLTQAASSTDESPNAVYGLNEAGDAVGAARLNGGPMRAFLHSASAGRVEDLGTLGGKTSRAFGINSRGDVVGEAETADGRVHAFLFSGGSMKDLGALPGFEAASRARALNTRGQAVGECEAADGTKHAFVFDNGRLLDLNTAAVNLVEAGFVSLNSAYGVNAQGWVVGYGTTSDGRVAAFLAVPRATENTVTVPAPKADNYDVFYTKLTPKEGGWLDVGGYGHVFRPNVAVSSKDWHPYRDGRWIWTSDGWYWDSNESFGWATYHYGGWIWVEGVGWCWAPGRHWAPCWVSWRQGADSVGWAPLPPEAAAVEVDAVEVSSSCDGDFGLGPGIYTFIAYKDWLSDSYGGVCYSLGQVLETIGSTTNVTNIYAATGSFHSFGVDPVFLESKVGHLVHPLALELATTGFAGGGPYHASVQGDVLRVAAPGAHLAPTAGLGPSVERHIVTPRSNLGWTGVPPDRLSPLHAAMGTAPPVTVKPRPGVRLPVSLPGALPRPKPMSFLGPSPPNLARPVGLGPVPPVKPKVPAASEVAVPIALPSPNTRAEANGTVSGARRTYGVREATESGPIPQNRPHEVPTHLHARNTGDVEHGGPPGRTGKKAGEPRPPPPHKQKTVVGPLIRPVGNAGGQGPRPPHAPSAGMSARKPPVMPRPQPKPSPVRHVVGR
jgi:probable HAF family extracellular repeat protein